MNKIPLVFGILNLKDPKIYGMLCTIATCNNMGVSIPNAIREYFSKLGKDFPEILPTSYRDSGGISRTGEIWCDINFIVWESDSHKGIEIDIENLPREVRKIKIVNP